MVIAKVTAQSKTPYLKCFSTDWYESPSALQEPKYAAFACSPTHLLRLLLYRATSGFVERRFAFASWYASSRGAFRPPVAGAGPCSAARWPPLSSAPAVFQEEWCPSATLSSDFVSAVYLLCETFSMLATALPAK